MNKKIEKPVMTCDGKESVLVWINTQWPSNISCTAVVNCSLTRFICYLTILHADISERNKRVLFFRSLPHLMFFFSFIPTSKSYDRGSAAYDFWTVTVKTLRLLFSGGHFSIFFPNCF